jgi:hypothetical protein
MTEKVQAKETNSNKETAIATKPAQRIVIDLGRHKKKRIRDLRKGEGRLMADLTAEIEALVESGVLPKDQPPVVFVVRQKRDRRI